MGHNGSYMGPPRARDLRKYADIIVPFPIASLCGLRALQQLAAEGMIPLAESQLHGLVIRPLAVEQADVVGPQIHFDESFAHSSLFPVLTCLAYALATDHSAGLLCNRFNRFNRLMPTSLNCS